MAPDGRCKAFGAEADGYGRGEGYTVAVLEPVSSLRADQHSLVLLTGSAVNQDGRSSSLTVSTNPTPHHALLNIICTIICLIAFLIAFDCEASKRLLSAFSV